MRTNIEATMRGVNSTVYLRVPFSVSDTSELDSLSLEMKYNDGFAAYLNGTEVARRNTPISIDWNSAATAPRSPQDSLAFEAINLTGSLDLLNNGLNVLAIHGLNNSATDDAFLVAPELVGGGVLASEPLYFASPTAGTINSTESFGIVADTKFTVDRGFYDSPFEVEISTQTEGAAIRYTTDGSAPSASHDHKATVPRYCSKW